MGFEDQMMTKDKYSVSAYFSQVEPILFYCPSNILKRAGKKLGTNSLPQNNLYNMRCWLSTSDLLWPNQFTPSLVPMKKPSTILSEIVDEDGYRNEFEV